MFVFGGWVPLISSEKNEQFANEKEWKCTNTLASFNLGNVAYDGLSGNCIFDLSLQKRMPGNFWDTNVSMKTLREPVLAIVP